MKELLLINDNTANKISYYHLLFLLASLPFDRFYSHIILISFAAHTLIHLKKDKLGTIFTLNNLVLQSAFIVTLIAALYSKYLPQAITELTLRLPILLLPILLSLTNIDVKKYIPILLKGFALVCVATVVYLYFDAYHTIRYYHLPLKTIFTPAFTNHNFSEPLDIHATFFSFQLVIGLVYFFTILFKQARLSLKLFYVACCLILLCGLIQLSSKSILIILFVIINAAIPYYLLKGENRLMYVLAALMISAIGITALLNIPSFRERYITTLKTDLSVAKPTEGADPRLARWEVVAKVIKQKPVLGHGSGSEVLLLKDGFFDAKLYNSFLVGLNAHNEYLSFWLKSGIWGLLVYLFTLAYGFRAAFKKRNLVFISFMLVIAVVSLSEDVLDMDKGVMFYSLFFSLFMLPDVKKQEPLIEDPKSDEYLTSLATNRIAVTSY
ncbi:O-antigen ligase [Mucilaginibacter pineti]|uniref:O-antigen ligase n=1 Tax=Mucilaginibacter pineti TaxID=1391627 RepID=A0A1G6T9N9_9SPHI|nr:O-antigen ligase family protein [Mucilaginibacter pineti]SDD25035.1 O-antigen ligase [Mucilaginibacter pineti]